MTITIVTPPESEPITLQQARDHLRVDGADEDDLIAALIATARDMAEVFTRRQLVEATLKLTLDAFPGEGVIRIPRPPLIAVTALQYIDTGGVEQTLDADRYQVDALGEPGRVVPAYGRQWPATRQMMNAVSVTYRAGYATGVPDLAKHLVKLLLAHLYENRNAVGAPLEAMPLGVRSIAGLLGWGDYQ